MKLNSACVSHAHAHRAALAVELFVLLLLLPTSLRAEPVTLKHAVELALKHATTSSIAAADQQRAFASYRELRNSYVPQLTAGAGLGWSYGFPLSLEGAAPSLFNINARSPLYHFELKDFLAAARAETAGASLHSKDGSRDSISGGSRVRRAPHGLLRCAVRYATCTFTVWYPWAPSGSVGFGCAGWSCPFPSVARTLTV